LLLCSYTSQRTGSLVCWGRTTHKGQVHCSAGVVHLTKDRFTVLLGSYTSQRTGSLVCWGRTPHNGQVHCAAGELSHAHTYTAMQPYRCFIWHINPHHNIQCLQKVSPPLHLFPHCVVLEPDFNLHTISHNDRVKTCFF
jgi:hypothetical protein